MKTCSKCKAKKPLTDFYADKRYRDGYRGQCRRCVIDAGIEHRRTPAGRSKAAAAQAARRLADPLRLDKDWRGHLWQNYRLTPEGFTDLLASQDGQCALCKTTEPGGRGRFHVDHDHRCCPGKKSCGKCIRGLLCGRCNVGIGMLGDDPERLIAAAAYLIERMSDPALLQALGATVG